MISQHFIGKKQINSYSLFSERKHKTIIEKLLSRSHTIVTFELHKLELDSKSLNYQTLVLTLHHHVTISNIFISGFDGPEMIF